MALFGRPVVVPDYPDVRLYTTKEYLNGFPLPRPWEFNGWRQESLSWKTGCSLHAGLSGAVQFRIQGSQAKEFLSWSMMNGMSTFEVGMVKHAVLLNDAGLVAVHGVLEKDAEDSYRAYYAGGWAFYLSMQSDFDVQISVEEVFLFQIGGPTSLQTLEAATGESLRDIAFLRARKTTVAGVECDIARVGMSGTLAYELRGPLSAGEKVYEAVYNAGQAFGMERMGEATYLINHVENGFAQVGHTFAGACEWDPGYRALVDAVSPLPALKPTGSVDPTDLRSRMRTPVEIDWQRAARFDHDFIGREALEKEMADPKRTVVTLVWNPEDVLDIWGSLLAPGEEYKALELPHTPLHTGEVAIADHVLKDGEWVGISSGATYSYYYRAMISHCTIDLDAAKIGTEVIVQWGDYGKRIKDVHATVARFPYLDLPPNRDIDVASLP